MSEVTKTLRQLVRYAKLSKDERILRETGFYEESGALSEQGRRIIIDTLWENDADVRKVVTAAVRKTQPKKGKKADEDEE